jgi:ATP-dependent RNA helicase RhlE
MENTQPLAGNTAPQMENQGFSGLGIAPKLLGILASKKFVQPTPIQQRCIPSAIEGKDLIGIAQTGTGKTLAFVIPLLQRLSAMNNGSTGLILVPTRELALQVEETISNIGGPLGVKTAVVIGGASMYAQTLQLRRNPNIIIATPGRLIDHLSQKTVNLGPVRVLILDEADRMLDMGFAPQLDKILPLLKKEKQVLLFSATMPDQIVKIANKHMQLPLRVEVARAGTAAAKVIQEIFFLNKPMKTQLLASLLNQYRGTVLVFVRTKHAARRLTRDLNLLNFTASEIHGDRSLSQRKEALAGFKTGRYRVLVATDIAARGIDVTGIELVVNFDLPMNPEDYVHRIGRTGRAGMAGRAISFATFDQRNEVRIIERLTRVALPVSELPKDMPALPEMPKHTYIEPTARPTRRPYHSSGPSRSSSARSYAPRASSYGSHPSGGGAPSTGHARPSYGRSAGSGQGGGARRPGGFGGRPRFGGGNKFK